MVSQRHIDWVFLVLRLLGELETAPRADVCRETRLWVVPGGVSVATCQLEHSLRSYLNHQTLASQSRRCGACISLSALQAGLEVGARPTNHSLSVGRLQAQWRETSQNTWLTDPLLTLGDNTVPACRGFGCLGTLSLFPCFKGKVELLSVLGKLPISAPYSSRHLSFLDDHFTEKV